MLPKLQSQFNQIEQLKQNLLDSLDQFNESQLGYRISQDSWSRLQVAQHLVIVEKVTLAYMQKKILSFPTAKKVGQFAGIRSAFLTLTQRMPFKYKIPTKRVASEGDVIYSDLKDEWQTIRQHLQTFLGQFSAENIHYPILRNPLVGLLNISQTLRFIEEHFKHHLRQFARIHRTEESKTHLN